MRWIKYMVVTTFITAIAIGTGCGKKAVDKIGYGTLENGTYQNEFFYMSVKFPSDWNALDDQSRKEMMQSGKKLIAGQDKNLQAVLDASEPNSVNLFMVTKFPLGSPVPFNPSIGCVAEKVSQLPGIKKGSDYLYHMKSLMEKSQVKYYFSKDVYSEKVGGKEFGVQDVEINMGSTKIKQKYYAAIMKGYALAFVVTSSTDEEKDSLNQILAAVKFHNP